MLGNLDYYKDLILTGSTTVDKLAREDPTIVSKYYRTLDRIEDICMRKRRRTEMTKGIWYFGKTGVGKSHKAFENYTPETHYQVPTYNNRWDGYKQQDTVILDGFRGQISYDFLLEMVDKSHFSVPIRRKEPMPFLSKKVIVTSLLPPEEVYKNIGKDISQLYRRFEVIEISENGTEHKWLKSIEPEKEQI